MKTKWQEKDVEKMSVEYAHTFENGINRCYDQNNVDAFIKLDYRVFDNFCWQSSFKISIYKKYDNRCCNYINLIVKFTSSGIKVYSDRCDNEDSNERGLIDFYQTQFRAAIKSANVRLENRMKLEAFYDEYMAA